MRQTPGPVTDVPFVCPKCRALWLVKRQNSADVMLSCLECGARLDSKSVDAGRRISPASLDALHARTARIRLHWFAGFVSEYPDPIDEDTRAVSLNVEAGLVVLHATTGDIRRFEDAHETDADGFATFRERSLHEQVQHRPATVSGATLPVEECFDYVTVVPAVGEDWHARSRADGEASTNERRLVGRSPQVRIESAGILKGGGSVSALCDLIRPAVLASRVVLSASDRTDATASAVSFYLDQGVVDAFRVGDVINLTRSPRGGLGVSVIRGNELVVALGVVTAVPLAELRATVRRDQVVRQSGFLGESRTGRPWLHAVQVTTAHAVPRKPKGFTIRTWYGAWPAPTNADECVSIVRKGRCSEIAAFTSTLQLATSDALHVER
jgi:hypothetical protein